MAPTRCDCGDSVGNHNCISALKAKVKHQRELLEKADELAKWAMDVQKRLLAVLHERHYQWWPATECPKCRSVVNGVGS